MPSPLPLKLVVIFLVILNQTLKKSNLDCTRVLLKIKKRMIFTEVLAKPQKVSRVQEKRKAFSRLKVISSIAKFVQVN